VSSYVTGMQVTIVGLAMVFLALGFMALSVCLLSWAFRGKVASARAARPQLASAPRQPPSAPQAPRHLRPEVVAAIVAAVAAYRGEKVPTFRLRAVTPVRPRQVLTRGRGWVMAGRQTLVNRARILQERRRTRD